MWSLKGISILWCLVLMSSTFALPSSKLENESDSSKPDSKPDPILLEIEMPADEKPTDNSKPSELAIDPKPIEAKPTEQTKPSESSGGINTNIENAPLDLDPPRRQMLYDQRQDGKYNIRADLENFVILVVPSSGNSLLDLLKRSSQRQQQQQQNKRPHHASKTHHKKYHSVSSTVKANDINKKAANRLDYLNHSDGEESSSSSGVGVGVGEFIEGRTPYHVDISSEEILQPAAYGVRSLNENAATIADLPLVNVNDNMSSTKSDATDSIIISTVTGKSSDSINLPMMSNSNIETSPRFSKSLTIDGYGNPFTSLNTVLLTRKTLTTTNNNDHTHDRQLSQRNYNNYFSRKPSVQIVDKNTVGELDNMGNDNLYQTPIRTEFIDLTDSKTSFDSLNVGNIDRLALAGDHSTKPDTDLMNAQWELTLLGAEEQCGPDRRRDSYGICQFVPADYATT